jgi:hypothetical protein
MSLIQRLLRYRMRKMIHGKEPEKIVLSWKHQLEIERWVVSCDMKMSCLKTIIGYRILGMKIVDKGA